MQTFLKTVLPYVFCALAGYLAGAVNFAWLLAKKRGFDIRTKGSGNAGTTNAGRTMGSGVAVVVFLCDALNSASVGYLVWCILTGRSGWDIAIMAATVALIFWKHRKNFVRLVKGKELGIRASFFKKKYRVDKKDA